MPLETRNAKKGIPPKKHQPRGTKSITDKNGKTKPAKTTRKRSASLSNSSSNSDSEHEGRKEKKQPKRPKRHHVSESEVEEVAADGEPLEVEHVDMTDREPYGNGVSESPCN